MRPQDSLFPDVVLRFSWAIVGNYPENPDGCQPVYAKLYLNSLNTVIINFSTILEFKYFEVLLSSNRWF